MSYSYRKSFTTDATQCGTADSTNFPICISLTDADFATAANGGKARNSSGFDIGPFSDSALTTALTYELVYYNAVTGQIEMHVKVGTLSHTTNLVSYLGIGDASISTDGSSSSTWNSNYKGVWHLKDGTTLSALDSTSNASNGTAVNTPTAAVGQIDGGMAVASASSQYLDMGTPAALAITGAITVSAWAKVTAFPTLSNMTIVEKGYDGTVEQYFFRTNNDGTTTRLDFGSFSSAVNHQARWAISGWSTGTWHLLAGKYTGTIWKVWFDGAEVATSTDTGPAASTAKSSIGAAAISGAFSRFFDGVLDEVRVSAASLSDSWLLAEYNNQKASSTFLTWGSLVAINIGFDAASNSGYKTAQSTYSWNHTCTGTNRYLMVGISMLSVAGSSVTGITYNGIALSLKRSQASVSGAVRAEYWELVNPTSGTNSIAVTLSASLDSIGGAQSYIEVNQTVPSESDNSATATNIGAADATVNVTTVTDLDMVLDVVATDDTAITVGSGQTSRWNVTGTLGSGAGSNEGPKTPAGSVTMNWTNVAALATWSIVAAGIRFSGAANATASRKLALLGAGL